MKERLIHIQTPGSTTPQHTCSPSHRITRLFRPSWFSRIARPASGEAAGFFTTAPGIRPSRGRRENGLLQGRWWIFAALTGLTGCATTEHPTATRTIQSLRETQTGAVASRDQIDGTIRLLDELVRAPQADMRPLYQKLVLEMKRIEAEAERAARSASLFREHAFVHDVTWTADLKITEDTELQRLRSRTQENTRSVFREVEVAATDVRTGYWSVLEEVRGLARHLEQDLTAGGVAAIEPLFTKTQADARSLRDSIDRLLGKLDAAIEALSPKAASAGATG